MQRLKMMSYKSRMAPQRAALRRPTSVLQEQGQMRIVERNLIAVEAEVSRVCRSRGPSNSMWCWEEKDQVGVERERGSGCMDVAVRCCSTFIATVAQSEHSVLIL